MTATKADKCRDCGGDNEVIGGLCESCEDNYVYCSVCKDHLPENGHCRHVGWSDIGYVGAGATETEPDDCKESFFVLLDILSRVKDATVDGGVNLIDAMHRYIRKHNFWTFMSGPMIGGPPNISFQRECRPGHHSYFASLSGYSVEEVAGERQEEAADGWRWLQSLEPGKTKKADLITCRWIREWKELKR